MEQKKKASCSIRRSEQRACLFARIVTCATLPLLPLAGGKEQNSIPLILTKSKPFFE